MDIKRAVIELLAVPEKSKQHMNLVECVMEELYGADKYIKMSETATDPNLKKMFETAAMHEKEAAKVLLSVITEKTY
jgi:rubrerythrin